MVDERRARMIARTPPDTISARFRLLRLPEDPADPLDTYEFISVDQVPAGQRMVLAFAHINFTVMNPGDHPPDVGDVYRIDVEIKRNHVGDIIAYWPLSAEFVGSAEAIPGHPAGVHALP